jgi:signal transduction histidine kinase
MKIPPFLEAAYRSDHAVESFVSSAIVRIVGHIASNRMVFFPEYTDHSITHIELTLQTALDLASGPARGLLTSLDAAVLVVAVALHDFGMYLSRDGFESLIAPDGHWKGVPYFDRQDWQSLWDDFYSEATRFDGRKLRQLFGDNYRPVRPLPSSGTAWEDFDYLLVGEFLRRHHPRLAHEIALYGLPGKNGNAITICLVDTEDRQFLADISGFVARSHGTDLRSCLSYIEWKYRNKINPRGTHPAFLAVLLRLADYFQIQAKRAPTEHTDVTSFQSRLSEREWKVHQSISDIHNTGNDPEAIVVDANPNNVETFLRLQKWLEGLQIELDRSWAVLGEVFGLQSHNNLHLLGIKIRRVKSNIDDVSSFAKTVSYVPAQIAYEVANADLLKLLVAPLYSDDPGIGIRELFQNAVDAVREFEDMLLQHPEIAATDRFVQDADITLNVKCDDNDQPEEIVVIDRGVGMTAEVVQNYFLKAGASFRRSNTWREEHEDSKGNSRVLRTGRFGVGVLAAFLLGDEIEVTTRHAMSPERDGVTFTAKLDDEVISLNRVECPAGTRIRIRVPERLKEHVKSIVPGKWEEEIDYSNEAGHYFLQRPSLKRHFSNGRNLPVKGWLPQVEDDISTIWRCFKTKDFEKIFWTYRKSFPHLSSNGIVIQADTDYDSQLGSLVSTPRIAVFDRDGRLPVNLQRTGLQGDLPFEDELLRSISEDILAHAITEAPKTYQAQWFDGIYEGFHRDHYFTSIYSGSWPRWLIGRDGFILGVPQLIAAFQPQLIVMAFGGKQNRQIWGEKLRRRLPPNVLLAPQYPEIFSDNNPRIKGIFQRSIHGRLFPDEIQFANQQVFVPQKLVEKIKTLRPGRQVSSDLEQLVTFEQGRWKAIGEGKRIPWLETMVSSLPIETEHPMMFCAVHVNSFEISESENPLAKRWIEIAGTPLVPFDTQKRKKLEAHVEKTIGNLLKVRRAAALENKASKNRAKSDDEIDDDKDAD